MNHFKLVVVTDYGDVELTGDRAQIINASPKRRDGQPDRRYSCGKLAHFIIGAIMDRERAKFLTTP